MIGRFEGPILDSERYCNGPAILRNGRTACFLPRVSLSECSFVPHRQASWAASPDFEFAFVRYRGCFVHISVSLVLQSYHAQVWVRFANETGVLRVMRSGAGGAGQKTTATRTHDWRPRLLPDFGIPSRSKGHNVPRPLGIVWLFDRSALSSQILLLFPRNVKRPSTGCVFVAWGNIEAAR